MNMEQEVIKAATGVATTAANNGIGKLTDLVFSKQIRQQKRLDHLSSVQDQKDAELIQQGLAEFRDGRFILIEEQIGNPTSPLGLILTQNNQNQSNNLGKCLNKAYEHLSDKEDEQISDEQISGTFFNKWVNYSKEVSEEELQDLWGRILGEEISSPNSINYLILNTLSLMSKQNLENFIKLLPYSGQRWIFIDDSNFSKGNWFPNLNRFQLEELVDLNIIEGLTLSEGYLPATESSQLDGQAIQFLWKSSNKDYAIFIESESPIKLEAFRLTTIGYQLLKLAEQNIDLSAETEKFAYNLLNYSKFSHIDKMGILGRISKESHKLIKYIARK